MRLLRRLFNKNKYYRNCYAITQGSYKGNFFVYIRHDDKQFEFLSLPENHAVTVSAQEFKQGIEKKIVDRIEKLPHNVYELCIAQYNEAKAKDNINRLKQSAPPDSVDSGERKN